MEAAGGFEPPHRGFAVRSLNHLGTPPFSLVRTAAYYTSRRASRSREVRRSPRCVRESAPRRRSQSATNDLRVANLRSQSRLRPDRVPHLRRAMRGTSASGSRARAGARRAREGRDVPYVSLLRAAAGTRPGSAVSTAKSRLFDVRVRPRRACDAQEERGNDEQAGAGRSSAVVAPVVARRPLHAVRVRTWSSAFARRGELQLDHAVVSHSARASASTASLKRATILRHDGARSRPPTISA